MNQNRPGDDFNTHLWAVVLAAGEGNRLKSLTTTPEGISVPKQYCSLHGGVSLLESTLHRAAAVAPKERVCTVVASQHQYWWENIFAGQPPESIVVQPRNRGTAIGIMLPLLHVLKRDPEARVVLLPSDHHIRDERAVAQALLQAADRLRAGEEKIVLLGIEPDEADAELGYIVRGEPVGHSAYAVKSFVEKPAFTVAARLVEDGALWNTFIVAGGAQALVNLFAERYPTILTELQAVVESGKQGEAYRCALDDLYSELPILDFSRDVLQGAEAQLEVLHVPSCGWTDLGTPKRVSEVLKRWPKRVHVPSSVTSWRPIALASRLNSLRKELGDSLMSPPTGPMAS